MLRLLERGENAVVLFIQDTCAPCREFKPKFEKIAQAFHRERSVHVVAMRVTPEVMDAFPMERLPTIGLFSPSMKRKGLKYKGPMLEQPLLDYINSRFKTHRLLNGTLDSRFGCLEALDELTLQLVQLLLPKEKSKADTADGNVGRLMRRFKSAGKSLRGEEKVGHAVYVELSEALIGISDSVGHQDQDRASSIAGRFRQQFFARIENKVKEVSAKMHADPAAEKRLMQSFNIARLFQSFLDPIPKVIHFIKSDGRADNFQVHHALAVKSAVVRSGMSVVFHCSIEPTTEAWRRIRPLVEVRETWPPWEMSPGQPLTLAAHQSDALRLKILLAEGGIYLDWDVIVLRDMTDLLEQAATGFFLAEEKGGHVIGNAVIGAVPNSPFLSKWKRRAAHAFDPSCYTCHSVQLARALTREYAHLVTLLPWEEFYYPGHEEEAMAQLFDPLPTPTRKGKKEKENKPEAAGAARQASPSRQRLDFSHSHAVHLFESGKTAVHRLKDLSPERIAMERTEFNLLVRNLLPL
jgi:hypothetical protein